MHERGAEVSKTSTKRKFPKEMKILLFLQRVVLTFYCWFWEQFILKQREEAGKPQLRTERREPGM